MAILIDGSIILFYFIGITSLGLYMGRREKSLHDFALGGRKMPWYAVMASIIAAEVSAATFLGAPGEGYQNQSLWYVQLVFGMILGRILVGIFFLKPYYTYKVYTVYDYLDVRFGPWSKNYVSGLFLIMRTLASGTRLFVPSLVMVLAWRMFTTRSQVQFSQQAVTSVHPYLVAIIILTIITCIYTTIGGIKAVIWTDLIQATLMFGSAIIAIVTLLYHIGGHSMNLLNGFHALADAVPQMKTLYGYVQTGFEPQTIDAWKQSHNLSEMASLDYVKLILASDYTVFSALIASTLTNMAYFGTDQDMVQRMLSAESYRKSRRSLLTAAVVDVPVATSFTFIGILLYVFYQQDPTFKPAANPDVFGSYILNVMPPVLRGIVLAGVFATAMGSLSAALNALATSATNDWYIPYVARRSSQTHHVAAARFFTAIFAVLMIAIAGCFAYAKVRDPSIRIIPVVLGIGNFIIGPMLGVFLIGMFTRRRGSDAGNMIAITVGMLATIYLGGLYADIAALLGRSLPPPVIRISFTWFALIGAVVVFAVGICFTTPQDVLDVARRTAELAREEGDRPLATRMSGGSPSRGADTFRH
jgi:SSS family transporter